MAAEPSPYEMVMLCLKERGKKKILKEALGIKNRSQKSIDVRAMGVADLDEMLKEKKAMITEFVIRSVTIIKRDVKSNKIDEWGNYVLYLLAKVDNGPQVYTPQEKNFDLGHNQSPDDLSMSEGIKDGMSRYYDNTVGSPSQADYTSESTDRVARHMEWEEYDDSDDDEDMDAVMNDLIGGEKEERLCPSCATGLCDTHVQLRF